MFSDDCHIVNAKYQIVLLLNHQMLLQSADERVTYQFLDASEGNEY